MSGNGHDDFDDTGPPYDSETDYEPALIPPVELYRGCILLGFKSDTTVEGCAEIFKQYGLGIDINFGNYIFIVSVPVGKELETCRYLTRVKEVKLAQLIFYHKFEKLV